MKCRHHPRYLGVKRPQRDCELCWALWKRRKKRGDVRKVQRDVPAVRKVLGTDGPD